MRPTLLGGSLTTAIKSSSPKNKTTSYIPGPGNVCKSVEKERIITKFKIDYTS